jgi:acetyl-CoA C-acetyltransferase
MKRAVIVAAARTPIGKFLGSLASIPATALGGIAIAEVVRRSGISPDSVEEVVMGNVVSAGLGQNPARNAGLTGGLPATISGLAINKVCGSGLAAVALAAQAVRCGDAEVVVAGGMESMSLAPHLLEGARGGLRLGHASLKDSVVHDGLWCARTDQHMGMTAERVASEYRIGREEQDAWALESHRRAAAATAEGRFAGEIVPVPVTGKKGETGSVAVDECPRADTTAQALARLRPAFKDGGTVTPGNAPGLNDGAAAVVVMERERAIAEGRTILAEVKGHAYGGVEPGWVMMAPVRATRRVLERTGDTIESIDLVEANEAFAVQAIAVARELKLQTARVNVNGGAVALGHPIGASGARILVTLIHALAARGLKRGLATLCLGGGDAVAMVIERPSR